MLYTRKGDSGTSGLFGTKERLKKDSLVYEALGTIDELNSLLGFVRAGIAKEDHDLEPWIFEEVRHVQEKLFIIQAELAGSDKRLGENDTVHLETNIQYCEEVVGNPHNFVISGESRTSSLFDYARAVSRRAERAVIRVKNNRKVSPETLMYLNRLSSFLYALARLSASLNGVQEKKPTY